MGGWGWGSEVSCTGTRIDVKFRFCKFFCEYLYAPFSFGRGYRFVHSSTKNTPCHHWLQDSFMNQSLTVL